MRRRNFLHSMTATLLAAPALAATNEDEAPGTGAPKHARSRPNIVVAISDDQSWFSTSILGSQYVQTPVFDSVAKQGALFTHCFCSAPSCTPSRGALLTGQDFWRLEEGANLWSTLPAKFTPYTDLLETAGYHVGFCRKGWGPGDFEAGGRSRNPAGKRYSNFEAFLEARPEGAPICFWYGSTDPHRPYEPGSGEAAGKRLEDVDVPPFLPDVPEVRSDLLDYAIEVERFDKDVKEVLQRLEELGEAGNTLVVITSDNGLPFPRGKGTLYDHGVRMPLAVRWPAGIPAGAVIDDLVSHTDLAPTFLEAVGVEPPNAATGRSLLPLLKTGQSGRIDPSRDRVFCGRERHVLREGGTGYPCRAVRTHEYLYIQNFAPERYPAGRPEKYFNDVDGAPEGRKRSPTKSYIIEHKDEPAVKRAFELAFEKRPAEELYDLKKDPYQVKNVAGEKAYEQTRLALRSELHGYLRGTGDPRIFGHGAIFDTYDYYGRKP